MRIQKRLHLNNALALLTAAVICLVLFLSLYRLTMANKLARNADEIVTRALEQVTIRNDYIRNTGARAKKQWFAKHEQIKRLLTAASKNFRDDEDRANIAELIEDHAAMEKIFSSLVAHREQEGARPGSPGLARDVEDRLLNQLDMRVYEIVLHSRRLMESGRQASSSALRLSGAGVVSALLILMTAVVINSWTMSRAIADRLRRLHDGVSIIGAGDLDHRINMRGDDEFARLSDAFNAMTATVRGSYRALESEVEERKRAEKALLKAQDELEMRVQERTRQLKELNETLESRVAARTADLQAALDALQSSRLASLNLMEDAIEASSEAESANEELRREVLERKRGEELMQSLNMINNLIHSSLDLPTVMERALHESARVLGCETAAISLKQDDRWTVSCSHGFAADVTGLVMNSDQEPHAVLAVTSNQPVAVNDATTDERVNRDHMLAYGIRSVLVVPLLPSGGTPGVIFFNYHKAPVTFTQSEIDFGRLLGLSLSLAVQNVRIVEEERQSMEERGIAAGFVQLLHEGTNRADLLRSAAAYFHAHARCEAVGIRLKAGDDYPYYEAHGFSHEFLHRENSLCTLDGAGQPVRDSAGYPIMECMCGNVIQGRFDPSQPFFTARGSFWTNSTTELLATSDEADRQSRTRNRCNGEGYESVALIAIRAGDETVGLIQLNDRMKSRFTRERISLWERLAGHLGIALEKIQAEEALKRANRRLAILSETAEALLASERPQEIVNELCRKVMEYLDCHAFFNFLADDETGRLRLNACAGIPEGEARRIEWLDYGVAVCGCAARDNCRIVAEHIPSTPDERTELVRSYGIKAYACHPLLGPGGKVIGTLSFGTRSRETFSNEELSLMKAVADQVAVAINRMAAEESLRRRGEELQAANRDLESFIYSVSHDLRTPMRSMAIFTKMIAERYADGLDAAGKDYFRRVSAAGVKMNRLVEDLLYLSRVSRQEIKRTRFDLSGRALKIIAELRESSPGRNVEVVIKNDMNVFADPQLIEIVLANLLGNAWKFTSKTEGARIAFGAEDQGDQTVYCVRDNGAGFDPAYAGKMFEPFQRLHSDDEFEGTGIGLAIVEQAIRRHGGKVWAEGDAGKGAAIYFTLT